MGKILLTSLRKNLFRIIDEVIKTGVPVEIERKGHRLKIIAEDKKDKFDNLIVRKCVVGNPDDLVHIKAAQWNEETDL